MTVLVWLIGILLGLSSSGPEAAPDEEPAEPSPPAATEAFPADLGPVRTQEQIEDRFLTRTPIPACDVVQTDTGGQTEPTSYDCLQQAADAGEGAELVFVTPQDPGVVLTYYRVSPGGPLEVFVDRREIGDPDWVYVRCPVPDDIRTTTCR
jgi:hypothetical protein